MLSRLNAHIVALPRNSPVEPGAAAPGSAPAAAPAQAVAAPKGGVLIDFLSRPVPVGGASVPPRAERAAPAVGFRVTGGTLLGVVPAGTRG